MRLMSTDAGAGTREESAAADATDPSEYDEMLGTLDVAIEEARRKIENGRVYDAENEKVRIKWVRALAYAVNVRRQITHDRDLEELAARMDEMEQDT